MSRSFKRILIINLRTLSVKSLRTSTFHLVRGLLIAVIGCSGIDTSGQIGGKYLFDFVNVPANARLAALGGVNVSLTDRDASLFSSNPAITGDTLQGVASASYQFYLADVGQAFISYAPHLKKFGTLNIGIQHMQYGTIQGFDDAGIETLLFDAAETALIISKNHEVGNFRLGANLKGIFSNLAGYRSSCILVDVGGVFIHPEQELTIGLVIRNVGFVFGNRNSYSGQLPFDVRAGVTLKPQHMPIRFSFTAFNLTQPDITYYDLTSAQDKPGRVTKLLSHINFGTEILIHRNVNILAGYNYLLHQALKLERSGAGAGFTFGFSAAVRNFEFVFSRSGYVAGNAAYGFTVSADLNKLIKKG